MKDRKPGNRQRLSVGIAVVHFGTLLLAGLLPGLAEHIGAVLAAEGLVVSALAAAIGADTVRPGGQATAALGGWDKTPARVADQAREP